METLYLMEDKFQTFASSTLSVEINLFHLDLSQIY